MRKSRFHFFVQKRYGENRSVQEISEKEFIDLYAIKVCPRVLGHGIASMLLADVKEAKIRVRAMKRSVITMQIFSCEDCTLSFRQDRKTKKEG